MEADNKLGLVRVARTIRLVFRISSNMRSNRWYLSILTMLRSHRTKVRSIIRNITNLLISIRMLFFQIKFKKDLNQRIKLIKLPTTKLRKFSKIKAKNRCQPIIRALQARILWSCTSIPTAARWEISRRIHKEAKGSFSTINKNRSSRFKKFKSRSNSSSNKSISKARGAIRVILKEVGTRARWLPKLILFRLICKKVNFS